MWAALPLGVPLKEVGLRDAATEKVDPCEGADSTGFFLTQRFYFQGSLSQKESKE